MTHDPIYRQSGVVPFRWRDGEIEVLLITSRRKNRWIFPKGIVEESLSPQASAAKEALEEAGVVGDVMPWRLGTYEQSKWGGTCVIEMFALEVTGVLADWDEAAERQRRWVPIDDVGDLVDREALVEFGEALAAKLSPGG